MYQDSLCSRKCDPVRPDGPAPLWLLHHSSPSAHLTPQFSEFVCRKVLEARPGSTAVLVCVLEAPEVYVRGLASAWSPALLASVATVDAFSTPPTSLPALRSLVDATCAAAGTAPEGPPRCIIVVDSVVPLVRDFGLAATAQFLQRLRSSGSPIVVHAQGDSLPSPALTSLSTMTTATIRVVFPAAAQARRSAHRGAAPRGGPGTVLASGAAGTVEVVEANPLTFKVSTTRQQFAVTATTLAFTTLTESEDGEGDVGPSAPSTAAKLPAPVSAAPAPAAPRAAAAGAPSWSAAPPPSVPPASTLVPGGQGQVPTGSRALEVGRTGGGGGSGGGASSSSGGGLQLQYSDGPRSAATVLPSGDGPAARKPGPIIYREADDLDSDESADDDDID